MTMYIICIHMPVYTICIHMPMYTTCIHMTMYTHACVYHMHTYPPGPSLWGLPPMPPRSRLWVITVLSGAPHSPPAAHTGWTHVALLSRPAPRLLPLLCPQVSSLCLSLYFCLAHRSISTVCLACIYIYTEVGFNPITVLRFLGQNLHFKEFIIEPYSSV